MENEFDQYIRGLISEIKAQESAPAGQPGQNPVNPVVQQQTSARAPINVTIGGKQYAFPDEAALSSALEQTFQENQTALEEARKAQVAQVPAQPGAFVGAGDAKVGFSQDKYIELMQKNAMDAQEYLDSHRYFGGQVAKPSDMIRAAMGQAV